MKIDKKLSFKVWRAIANRANVRAPVSSYYLARRALLPDRAGEMWMHPHFPRDVGYTISKICADLRLRISPIRTPATTIAFALSDATKSEPFEAEGTPVINGRCTDISKSRVQDAFHAAFGYPLAIDPRTYTGPCVSKSDENASHDGHIVTCPIRHPQEGQVYQFLVDSEVGMGMIEELRVPIIGQSLPFVYVKRRWKEKRFDNYNTTVSFSQASSMLNEEECANIVRMARALNMQFGEMDILRDRYSSKIFVVDANKTPVGPPAALAPLQKLKAVRLLAAAFEIAFL